ncbi:alpha/beta hydrolase [Mycolicibacterium psychrotolerans]|uniref:Alpha/beta hydrolase n=1 Tax=Mycolicibacterium psychrotolerans TaxID=216929 RepID=A0A7I7M5K8_9MYCO|nr:alpha/beta hydrolase [Mycolicibacterium psychrotolerans]BBX67464.1 hypothetical protein MPSYJ_09250 [Mycolicibacterium psychrotolerans]
MAQLSAWMGAGVVAAGVSAALIAGADTASADTGSDTAGATASTSDTTDRGPRASGDAAGESDSADASSTPQDTDTDTDAEEAEDADVDEAPDAAEEDVDSDADAGTDSDSTTDSASDRDHDAAIDGSSDDEQAVEDDTPELTDRDDPGSVDPQPPRPEGSAEEQSASPITPTRPRPVSATNMIAAQRVVAAFTTPTAFTTPAVLAAPEPRTLQEVIQSLVTELIGAAIRFVAGPPVVPPGVNVTVRSSRLEITEGRFVRADWYYPEGDELPERFIYLQHGYRGVGPMYSYTASWLAERTNSIVVVPTLSSNPYVRDGFWLGDDQVYRATAALLLGDRDALTASAVAAGFARKYGSDAALPDRFTLVGHSLGAGVVAGTAGYYADAVIAGGAVNQLAGVITLDGAPPGSVLADALDKLDGLGAYIPVIELGAPREDGSPRRVDEALNGHRPGHFNGVVLDNGQHLDSMQGGSRAIQLISYLNQGFPTEQNKSAAQTLIAGWINDIFAGRIDPSTGACQGSSCAGIYGEPGEALSVATPVGTATGVVIGSRWLRSPPSSGRCR